MTGPVPTTALVAAIVSLCATTLSAQRTARAALLLGRIDHRVDAGFGVERSSGLVVGAEARLDWSPRLHVAVTGVAGHLDSDAPDVVDRDLAELDLRAQFAARSWLGFEAGVTVRSYSTVVARQRWSIVRAGAVVRAPLSGGALHAVGHISLLPLVSVGDLPRPDMALRAGVGFAYVRGRVAADLRFALERCDFATPGGDRAEQVSSLTLTVGYGIALSGSR